MPRVFVNGKFLTQRLTGVQRFAFELTKIVVPHFDVIVLAPKGNYRDLPFPVTQIGSREGVFWEQWDLPNYVNREGGLLLNFCNVAPLRSKKNIVTIHDLAFERGKDWFSLGFRSFYKFLIPRIAKSALKVLTVSEFSRNELIELYGLDEKKIAIVNNLSNQHLKAGDKEPYLLYVGSLNPRKNLRMTLAAFNQSSLKMKFKVVGASENSFKDEGLEALLNDKRIEMLGYVSDEELGELLAKASNFVSLSHYEGFNIPILEALLSGCGVLASDIPVHKELYDGWVAFANPNNIEDIRNKLEGLDVIEQRDVSVLRDRFNEQKILEQFKSAVQGLI